MENLTVEPGSDSETDGEKSARRLLKVLFVALVLLIGLVLTFQYDTELSPDARTWLEAYDQEHAKESEAFLYLLGIENGFQRCL